jgi:ribosome-binding factor A
MSDRMLQINEQLRSEIAQAISREVYINDGLITVTKVKCAANLQHATVFVSVLPENVSGSALAMLKKNNSLISKYLSKLNLKYTPKLRWRIDDQERYAADINRVINEING